MSKLSRWLAVAFLACVAEDRVAAHPDSAPIPTIVEKTADTEKFAGYFNLYWDAKQGKLWLEIDKWGTEFLYQSGLSAGIGSNDIGLDRGQLAPAEGAAQHSLQFLFNPERAARLVEFHARNENNPGREELLDSVLNATWKAPHAKGYYGEIAQAVDNVVLL
jgi:hypothetical protein